MFLMVKTLISVYKIMDGREILKGLFTQNWQFSQHLFTVMLFQTCTSFFLLMNTKEDILKNIANQTVDGTHWPP